MLEDKIKVSSQKLRELVFQVASDLDWAAKDEKEEFISFVYEGDFFSFGNKINIEIIPVGKICKLKIESKSLFALQILDWGTNSELEKKFMEEIKDKI